MGGSSDPKKEVKMWMIGFYDHGVFCIGVSSTFFFEKTTL